MRKQGIMVLRTGIIFIVLFAVWTELIQMVDVQPVGETGTAVGFATLNHWFHRFTGVHMQIYMITDWMGLVPICICFWFGGMGLIQTLKRKSLLKVDFDIVLLGFYYLLVIAAYVLFEMLPINYRPILIEGRLEPSYPSSTTLLVLSVMPTLVFQSFRRLRNETAKKGIAVLSAVFSLFMVIGRLISGVHWVTDIVGAVLLSAGLFCMYKAGVLLYGRENRSEGVRWNFARSFKNCGKAED